MQSIVETFSITKRFSTSKNYRALFRFHRQEDLTAVDAVTLQVREGELFGLLGPNGAGKTTLVKMLCTLILPTEGHARVCGKDIVTGAASVKRSIGLVDSQERSFFWRLSGRENLEFFAALHGLHGAQADVRIAELLALVGLSEHADRRFTGYSTGMRQKLAIARGLMVNPPVLFMDEPTRSLDPVSAGDLRTFIRETLVERLGRTVVLVTHRLEEAEQLCDRVAIMNYGRIIACGPVADIKQRISVRQRYHLRVQYLSLNALDELDAIPGVVQLQWATGNPHNLSLELLLADEKETLPKVMRSIVSQGGDIQHCRAQGVSLEEAFVHLVREDRNDL
jgi:ABC-2 type transport system ATP-binding protein